jgi:formylglycine-generating enzyme required for sulfatase activity
MQTQFLSKSFLFLLLMLLMQFSYSAQKRVALIIGNSDYKQFTTLSNPKNDARDISRLLKQLNYDVHTVINADKRTMDNAIRNFSAKLNTKNSIGLFYYAGHAVQVRNRNYLLPLNSNIKTEADVPYNSVEVGWLMAYMEQAQNNLNLIILDACRDNPFGGRFRSAIDRGLAKMDIVPEGSMIMYAASPGQKAEDGNGRNGLFTAKLLEVMKEPGLTVDEVINKTARAVRKSSSSGQLPYKEGIMLSDYYITGKPEKNNVTTQSPGKNNNFASQIERDFWNEVKNDPSQEMYQAYLDQYPNGFYSRIAIIKLKKFTGSKPGQLQLTQKSGSRSSGSAPSPPKGTRTSVFQIPAKTTAKHQNIIWKDPAFNIEMIKILPGCFQMGSPVVEQKRDLDEKQHRVCINKPFFIGRYEVTQQQWQTVMNNNPASFSDCKTCPVENISWFNIQRFLTRLNRKTGLKYRLPTEAEWEYVARANSTTPFATGHCLSIEQANFKETHDNCIGQSDNQITNILDPNKLTSLEQVVIPSELTTFLKLSKRKTKPVGSYPANPWGVFDIHGNVSEWTCSEYFAVYNGTEQRCQTASSSITGMMNESTEFVNRGGSWALGAQWARSAERSKKMPSTSDSQTGFRLVRDL